MVDLNGEVEVLTFDTPKVPVQFSTDVLETAHELPDSHARWARSILDKHPNARVAVICNTVKRAQETAEFLMAAEVPTILLHSRMTTYHRKQVTKELESAIGKGGSGKGLVVVGTQVIEASLDIDVDYLRTENCPAASLIQRMGRAHRRVDPERSTRAGEFTAKPICVTHVPDKPTAALPYAATELNRVFEWITQHEVCLFPDQSQEFIDSTSFSLEMLAEHDDLDDEFSDYLVKTSQGSINAATLTQLSNTDVKLRYLQQLTDTPQAGVRTRISSIAQERVILCADPGSGIPGAWEGDPQDFVAPRLPVIRQFLEAAITIPVYQAQGLTYLNIESERSALKYAKLVHVSNEVYDPDLGFIGVSNPVI